MTDQNAQSQPQAPDADDAGPADKLVPVGESIRYRRRAQQAEARLAQIEQQLKEVQDQLERRADELATAEAQRDEARQHALETDNRAAAHRMLGEAGVVDLETAWMLLGKRLDLHEPIEDDQLAGEIERLLTDKPFLQAPASLPKPTASARQGRGAAVAQLATVARQAAVSGNRRDVINYLRLRRATSRQ